MVRELLLIKSFVLFEIPNMIFWLVTLAFKYTLQTDILERLDQKKMRKMTTKRHAPYKHNFRKSRLQMFFKIGVLKNCATFTGKHWCWILFLIELQCPEGQWISGDFRCFPVNIRRATRNFQGQGMGEQFDNCFIRCRKENFDVFLQDALNTAF